MKHNKFFSVSNKLMDHMIFCAIIERNDIGASDSFMNYNHITEDFYKKTRYFYSHV